MRHDVATPSYLFRRVVDNVLQAMTTSAPSLSNGWSANSLNAEALSYTEPKRESLTDVAFGAEPFGWLPLYTMVTFQPYLGYAVAQRRARRQARTLAVLEGVALIGAAVAVGWSAWAARGRLR
jgi:kynurenine 3-monooxygenase